MSAGQKEICQILKCCKNPVKMAGSLTREVITLQFGHYSSFVGTHWWNIQESSFCYDPQTTSEREINHDVLFREGQTLRGEETYTPRLMLFDLKGSLRNLPKYGTLYHSPARNSAATWSGETSVHESEPEAKNEFQMDLEDEEFENAPIFHGRTSDRDDFRKDDHQSDCSFTEDDKDSREKFYELDKQVMVWSDFLGICLHPKSIQLVGDFLHDSSTSPFDVFGYGQGVAKDGCFFDECESNLHFFVEECDSLQGFQIITDVFNGFGGLSSQVLEELRDEYGSKSLMTFGVTPAQFADGTGAEMAHRILNSTLSYSHLSQHSDVFVPLSLATETWPQSGAPRKFPHLTYKPSLPYHTSAVLGASIDTLTLPYRLVTPQASNMSSFLDSVAFGERKIASVSSVLPVPVEEHVPLTTLLGSKLNRSGEDLLTSLTPGVVGDSSLISQAAVIRGIPASLTHDSQRNIKTQKSLQLAKQQRDNPFEVCSSTNEIVRLFLQNLHPGSTPVCWNVNQACMVRPPFPNIFSPRVNKEGLVVDGYARPPNSTVGQTSVLSRLETSSGISSMLLSLTEWAKKVNIGKHHVFIEAGTDMESYKETLEELTNLAQRYEMP